MPNSPEEMAAALQRYPNSDDVAFARQQDWSYGKPWAPFFEGKVFNHVVGDPRAQPLKSEPMNIPAQMKGTAPGVEDFYAKAALAANRSALATLGFDPSKVAADLGTKEKARYGFFRPSTDETWVNARDPSTIVHEAIHRGTQKLLQSPYWKPEFNRYAGRDNEYLVRALMNSKMGDPEGKDPKADQDVAQRASAIGLFSLPHNKKALGDMEAAAAQYLAARQPRGPR